jgi:hypothetical protein
MSAKVIQVIEVFTTRGEGVSGDPVRVVRQYYSLEGELLAERDEWWLARVTKRDEAGE